jgi:hypothetical protein
MCQEEDKRKLLTFNLWQLICFRLKHHHNASCLPTQHNFLINIATGGAPYGNILIASFGQSHEKRLQCLREQMKRLFFSCTLLSEVLYLILRFPYEQEKILIFCRSNASALLKILMDLGPYRIVLLRVV